MSRAIVAADRPKARLRGQVGREQAWLGAAGAAAVGMALPLLSPLLRDATWVVPSLAGVGVVAATGWAARGVLRLAWRTDPRPGPRPDGVDPHRDRHTDAFASALVAAAAQAIALGLVLGSLAAMALGSTPVPGGTWLRALLDTLSDGLSTVETDPAPVGVSTGVLLVVVLAAGLAALAMDLLAVSLRRPALGGIVLLGFLAVPAAILDTPPERLPLTLAGVGYLGLLAVSTTVTNAPTHDLVAGSDRLDGGGDTTGRDTTGRERRDTSSAQAGGGVVGRSVQAALIGGIAIATAVVVAPLVSSDDALDLVDAGEDGGGQITTGNPIVDLRQELVRPDNVPVLHYRTQARSPEYLRMVSLDQFDGTSWFTSPRAVPPSQRVQAGLPPPPGLAIPSTDLEPERYDVVVSPVLDSQWLPLPYPTELVLIEGDWRYDAATLDVVAAAGTTASITYRAQARDLAPATADTLASPRDASPSAGIGAGVPGPDPSLLDVPPEIAAELTDLTAEVVGDAETDGEVAAALQRWFRSTGGFQYDITGTPAGSGVEALRTFLTERSGYCEQYAATMALMARTAGVPARVAVGYLPGTAPGDAGAAAAAADPALPEVPGEGTLREVRAHDAHAWPELYIEDRGWLRYEPTPSDVSGSPPVYSVPGSEGASEADDVAEPEPTSEPAPAEDVAADAAVDPVAGFAAGVWVPAVVGVVALIAVVGLGPPAVAAARRRWRWRRASTPAQAVWVAMDDLAGTARHAGLGWPDGASPRAAGAWLVEVAQLEGESAVVVEQLVQLAEQGWFTDGGDGVVHAMPAATVRARRVVRRHASPVRRLWAWWHPSPGRHLEGVESATHLVAATAPPVLDTVHEGRASALRR